MNEPPKKTLSSPPGTVSADRRVAADRRVPDGRRAASYSERPGSAERLRAPSNFRPPGRLSPAPAVQVGKDGPVAASRPSDADRRPLGLAGEGASNPPETLPATRLSKTIAGVGPEQAQPSPATSPVTPFGKRTLIGVTSPAPPATSASPPKPPARDARPSDWEEESDAPRAMTGADLQRTIVRAASGQLRDSEMPVPSERLDAEALGQLRELDEAIRSSRRNHQPFDAVTDSLDEPPSTLTGMPAPSPPPGFGAQPAAPPPWSEHQADFESGDPPLWSGAADQSIAEQAAQADSALAEQAVDREPPSAEQAAPSPGSVPNSSALPGPAHRDPDDHGLPRVGRYQVLARLKSGGMGSVYMCRLSDGIGFSRLFAMKVLHAHLSREPQAVENFLREARLLARLHHPNVVSVVDVGSFDEPYIVLDYVEGGSLQELFRATSSGRDPRLVVATVLHALEGLSATHEARDETGVPLEIIHCDVSPHNILVGVDGTARLTDFGVAEPWTTERGTSSHGKPSYLAPERLQGRKADRRSDVFSMGIVLYAGLTGVEPFAATQAEESYRKVLAGQVAPPSTAGFRPPAALDAVCLRAMAADSNERFQSAAEMITALRSAAEQAGLLSPSPSEVGAWVREALAPTLAARRAASRRGLGPARTEGQRLRARLTPVVPDADAEPPVPSQLDATSPIPSSLGAQLDSPEQQPSIGRHPSSSSALGSEVWQSGGSGARRTRGQNAALYVALVLATILLAWVVLFPESLAAFLKLPSAEAP